MIRLDGAVDFVSSLRTNTSLTYLDLSYNALGKEAGIVLGDAILDNRTLKHLLLCNNGIHAAACFSICQGIIENHGLKHVALDGNPIGEQGARALMMVPMFVGSRCLITANHCNIGIKDPDCGRFDLSHPCDTYALPLHKPFERAKALALLRIVAQHPTYILAKAMYEPPSNPSKGNRSAGSGRLEPLDLVQVISTEKEASLEPHVKPLVDNLRRFIYLGNHVDEALRAFDASLAGTDEEEISIAACHSLLQSLGVHWHKTQVIEALRQYDVDGGGMISRDEFQLFLHQQLEISTNKLRDLIEEPIMALSSAKGQGGSAPRYVPPRTGTLHLIIIDGFVRKPIYRAVSSTDREHIYQVAKSSGDTVQMIGFSVQNIRVRLDECLQLYEAIYKETRNKIKSIVMLLPYMLDYTEAKQFVSMVTDDDRVELQQVRQGLGNILRPIFGQPNGYYALDLTRPLDVLCLSRLLEISQSVNLRRKYEKYMYLTQHHIALQGVGSGAGKQEPAMPALPGAGGEGGGSMPLWVGDVSQHGNWTCFRNELRDGLPIEITSEAFTPMPTRGLIEFDFHVGSYMDLLHSTTALMADKQHAAKDHGSASSMGGSKSSPERRTSSPTKATGAKGRAKSPVPSTAPTNAPRELLPLPDRRFLRILSQCCLVRHDDHQPLIHHLKYLKALGDATLQWDTLSSNNNSGVHILQVEDSMRLFLAMENFYDQLHTRHAQFQKSLRNEEVKVNVMNPVKSDAVGTASFHGGAKTGGGKLIQQAMAKAVSALPPLSPTTTGIATTQELTAASSSKSPKRKTMLKSPLSKSISVNAPPPNESALFQSTTATYVFEPEDPEILMEYRHPHLLTAAKQARALRNSISISLLTGETPALDTSALLPEQTPADTVTALNQLASTFKQDSGTSVTRQWV